MNIGIDNGEGRVLNQRIDSSSVDDLGDNAPLKKGPWTSAEDAILIECVGKHGEGNWNAVQKQSGLTRCGKSCRLRWANHLRPGLKKGAFSPVEERQIIELHAKMGNKWARMATQLPGRTDNEIKNFWNTRIKRRQRAGLSIYPPDIYSRLKNENTKVDEVHSYFSPNVYNPDIMSTDNVEIPQVEFKDFNENRYFSMIRNNPNRKLPENPATLQSSCPITHSSKSLSGSELFLTGCNAHMVNSFNQLSSDSFLHPEILPASDQFPSSHAFLTGSSSSQPNCAMKLELPSLQNQMVSLGSPSQRLPVFEDGIIQTQICHVPTLAANVVTDSTQDLHTGWEYNEHFSSSAFCDSPQLSCNTFEEAFPGSI